ncbi:Serum paraoxonase/arylesterase 2 [Orbilia brochopaga]|uniref:Serum paraoxonase/arylesterase 2 n=1 Tax=Orbilia brochopaga TaxID=3140254 RepID=A0AAV9UFY4_9PEZI
MHPAIGAALTAALALLASYIVPWAARYPALLGTSRVWQPDPQFATLRDRCTALHPAELTGCEKFKIVGDTLFAACVADWDVRRSWFPAMRAFDRSIGGRPGPIRDRVYKVDLKTKELTRLAMANFPDTTDFCAHGMDVIEVAPGEFSLFLVNHRRDSSVVENFKYTAGAQEIIHTATFNGTTLGLYNPNDIFAVPISDDSPARENAFFVTNDHWFRDSVLGRQLELQLRLPTGSVYYHSESTGYHRVISGVVNANGIAGFQSSQPGAPPSRNTLFVAAILDGTVTAYNYNPNPQTILTKNGLTKLKTFTLDLIMDNLSISPDDKWLYMAGHGEPSKLPEHWAAPDVVASASVAYRVSLTELGGHFGTRGETGDSRVEKVVVDREGVFGNGSTTAVGDDERNKFWLSGLSFKGILECDLRVPRGADVDADVDYDEDD